MNTAKLKALHACGEAVGWTATQPNAKTAWATCQRGNWMLWLIGRTTKSKPWSEGRKPLLAACLDCADLVAHLRPKVQAKEIAAGVSVLREWIAGKASQQDAEKAVQQVRTAAYVAAYVAAADAAAYVAAYVAAADADAAAAAQKKTLAQCADIVRKYFPKPPKL